MVRRGAGAGLAIGLLLAAQPARAADLEQDAIAAIRFAAQGQCDHAHLPKIVKHKDFEGLSSAVKSYALMFAAQCSAPGERPALALRATAEPDAPADAWLYLLRIRRAQNDLAGALSAFEAAAKRAGPTGLKLSAVDVLQFYRQFPAPEDRRRFLEALEQARWETKDTFVVIDVLWRDHVLIFLERGDLANAQRLARRITDPKTLFSMRLDRRFDTLRAQNPEAYDIPKAALTRLEADRKALAERPDDNALASAVVEDLLLLGRAQEALDVAEAALRRAPENALNRNWLFDARSRALRALGRAPEAQSALRTGSRAPERRGQNVSQTINLAGSLRHAGRYQEALKVINTLGPDAPASPYGRMWIAAEKVCALSALQRGGEGKDALAFTQAHQADNPAARIEALFCVGDTDAAAQSYAARLMNPDQRLDALVELSAFEPNAWTTVQRESKARFAAVRDHPEVQKAVAAVGRLEPRPLKNAEWTYY